MGRVTPNSRSETRKYWYYIKSLEYPTKNQLTIGGIVSYSYILF